VGEPILGGEELRDLAACLDDPRPADERGDAHCPFPVRVLLRSEGRRPTVRPLVLHRAVVRRVEHDRVVGDLQVVEDLEQIADHRVVLDHPVRLEAEARLPVRLLLEVGEDVHPGGVEPGEERLPRLYRALHEVLGRLEELPVDRLHALLGQRPRVLDPSAGGRLEHAARTELLVELVALGIVRVFGFFLGVQMVKISEELIEAMVRRQELVAVAQVVLVELPGGVAERLQHLGDRRVFLLDPDGRAREADLREAGAVGALPPRMNAARPAVQLCWP
jgi:hypothetical protein